MHMDIALEDTYTIVEQQFGSGRNRTEHQLSSYRTGKEEVHHYTF